MRLSSFCYIWTGLYKCRLSPSFLVSYFRRIFLFPDPLQSFTCFYHLFKYQYWSIYNTQRRVIWKKIQANNKSCTPSHYVPWIISLGSGRLASYSCLSVWNARFYNYRAIWTFDVYPNETIVPGHGLKRTHHQYRRWPTMWRPRLCFVLSIWGLVESLGEYPRGPLWNSSGTRRLGRVLSL